MKRNLEKVLTRSSHKALYKNLQYSHASTFIGVTNVFKKRLQHRCFPMNIANIKNTYSAEHLLTAPFEIRIHRNQLQILTLASVLLHRTCMQSLRRNVCWICENRNGTSWFFTRRHLSRDILPCGCFYCKFTLVSESYE